MSCSVLRHCKPQFDRGAEDAAAEEDPGARGVAEFGVPLGGSALRRPARHSRTHDEEGRHQRHRRVGRLQTLLLLALQETLAEKRSVQTRTIQVRGEVHTGFYSYISSYAISPVAFSTAYSF